ncbi:MAG: proline--tRNA ligase [Chitinivibrionales bacterium]|nr:proline--tRNA ligase [Chitinivibrionales bacterium]
MLLSQLIGQRYRETPGEATLVSHAFLLRGGYMRQVANGIYSLLPLGVRVVHKVEQIIREEMNRIGGQEVLMPVVLPSELWKESGRYESVGSELLRFRDRTDHDMLLAMTHEEAVVHLTRNEANSYKAYPFMVYQIQTKFRDEPRSRGGLIRVREFTMKDAYSFHTDAQDLARYYEECAQAYHRIFARAGIPQVVQVESDTGMMGGRVAHEYMLLADSGEDTIVACDSCDYVSNLEVARSVHEPDDEAAQPLEKVHTPGHKTIAEVAAFLSVPERKLAKVVFYEADANGTPVLALIRGDLDVNEAKLSKVLGAMPTPASDETIRAAGAVPGFASAVGVHDCRVIADQSVADAADLVCGANEEDYHSLHFNLARDVAEYETVDIAEVKEGERCPNCDGRLAFKRGIEVGNIFQLGTKYTESMGMRYLDTEGNERTPIMGCYGIGVGRLAASVIEAHHDSHGPVWPVSVAPFAVHICALNLTDDQREQFAAATYRALQAKGIDVVYDDREERAGVQFADADLIGAPLRLIFGKRNLAEGKVEWKRRDGSEQGLVDFAEVVPLVERFVSAEMQKLG